MSLPLRYKFFKCRIYGTFISSLKFSTGVPTASSNTTISDYRYFLPIQTRLHENDPYHHINNTTYNSYVDTIINTYIDWYGFENQREANCKRLVVHASFDYKSPAIAPQILMGALRCDKIGRSSVQYGMAIFTPKKDYVTFLGKGSVDPLLEIGIGTQGLVASSNNSDIIKKLLLHYNTDPCLLCKYVHVFVDGNNDKPLKELPTNVLKGMQNISVSAVV